MCDDGETVACLAAADDERQSRICELGFLSYCDPWIPPETACTDGDWMACDSTGHTGVEQRVVEALAKLGKSTEWPQRLENNPGMYGMSLPVEGLGAACKEDSAVSCFAMGLNATADMNPFEHGLVPTRSLDITWGKACELGVNAACYAYAIRLLDRPFKEPNRDEKRANELLSTACKRGHVDSCWLQALELLELPAEIDKYRLREKICSQLPEACEPLE